MSKEASWGDDVAAAVEDCDDDGNSEQGDQADMPLSTSTESVCSLSSRMDALRIDPAVMPPTNSTLVPASIPDNNLAMRRRYSAAILSSIASPSEDRNPLPVRISTAMMPTSTGSRSATRNCLEDLKQAKGETRPSDGKKAMRSTRSSSEPGAGPSGLQSVTRSSRKPDPRVSDKRVQRTVSRDQEQETPTAPPAADDQTSEPRPRQRVPRYYREPYQPPPMRRRHREMEQNEERQDERRSNAEQPAQAPPKVKQAAPSQSLETPKWTKLSDEGTDGVPKPEVLEPAQANKISIKDLLKYGPYMRSPYQHLQATPRPVTPTDTQADTQTLTLTISPIDSPIVSPNVTPPPVTPPPEEELILATAAWPPPMLMLPDERMLPSSATTSPSTVAMTPAYAAAHSMPHMHQMYAMPRQLMLPPLRPSPPTYPARMYVGPVMYVSPIMWPGYQGPLGPMRTPPPRPPRNYTTEREMRKFMNDFHSSSPRDWGGRGRFP